MEAFVSLLILFLVAIIVMPIVAMAKTSRLERRVSQMSQEIWDLRRSLDEIQTARIKPKRTTAESAPQPQVEPKPVASEISFQSVREKEPERVESVQADVSQPVERLEQTPLEAYMGRWRMVTEQREAEPQSDEAPYADEQAPEAPRGRSAGEWEQLIAGNWFNRIGALALLIGLAFLLVYAFQHHRITPWTLIGAGFACGVGMMVAGERSYRGGAQVFAQGLIGGGISILYLSVYSSFNLYHLIPQTPALVLMCLVTAVALSQALRVDSLVVAVLGLIGGFLTPVLLGGSGGASGSGFGLFAYMAVLDAGLLALTLKKDDWAIIEQLALTGTYAVILGWYHMDYSVRDFAVAVGALIVFWGLFQGLDLYRGLKSIETHTWLRMGSSIVNAIAFYGFLYTVVNPLYPVAMPLVTLGIAVMYFAGLLVAMRRRTDAMAMVPRYSVTAVVLLVIATAVQFRHMELIRAALWAVEGLVLLWAGLRFELKHVRGTALLLMAVAVCCLFAADKALYYTPLKAFVPVWNLRFAAFVVVAAACAGAALTMEKAEMDGRDAFSAIAHCVWAGILFSLIAVEVNNYFERSVILQLEGFLGVAAVDCKALIMGPLWAALSAVLLWLGLRRRTLALTAVGLLTMAVAAVTTACAPPEVHYKSFVPVLNPSAFSLAVVIATAFCHNVLLSKYQEEYDWARRALRFVRVGTVVLGLEMISVLWWDYMGWRNRLPRHLFLDVQLHTAKLLVVGGIWAVYSALVAWRGYAKRYVEYIGFGLVALTVAVLIVAIQGSGHGSQEMFAPVANLRVAMFVVVALAMVAHYVMLKNRADDYELSVPGMALLQVFTSLLIFELVTVETWNALSGGGSVRHLAQMGLSVAWVVYSIILMGFGLWKRMRTIRFVALTLFEVTIVKVFLYDVSSLETLYRVFSFIGLGLFLMATSYLYQRYKGLILDDVNEAEAQ